jgi:cytidine deaminase
LQTGQHLIKVYFSLLDFAYPKLLPRISTDKQFMRNNNCISWSKFTPGNHTMNDFLIKSYEELSDQERSTVEAARTAIKNSYSPYSKFEVGAALRLEDGSIIAGSNQENMAYPSGTCAERAALFAYGSAGSPAKIQTLAVLARHHGSQVMASGAPCGGCRQVMLEYELKQGVPFQVIFVHDNKYVVTNSSKSLLPFHFHLDIPNE